MRSESVQGFLCKACVRRYWTLTNCHSHQLTPSIIPVAKAKNINIIAKHPSGFIEMHRLALLQSAPIKLMRSCNGQMQLVHGNCKWAKPRDWIEKVFCCARHNTWP